MIRYAELFAGGGGLSLGLHRAGWECAFHAEWSAAPRAVLAHRWPDVPLYGDVSELDGCELVARHGAIDILTGGSPCQDLSAAGRRAGLIGGSRSSLFFQQMRLWRETGAPLCLWENVAGAFSSNHGGDFAAVLSAFVGATVDVPRKRNGRPRSWPRSGWVRGPSGVAAWRVLDCQYFGPPQRRVRVFVLGARLGGIDPREVLLEPESVPGDSPTRGAAWEEATARARLRAIGARGVMAFHHTQEPITSDVVAPSLGATTDGMGVLAFNIKQDGADAGPISPTLLAMPHAESHPNGGGQVGVLAFDRAQITSANNRSRVEPGLPCPSLNGSGMMHVCVTGDVTHALTHEGADASEDGTGRGTPIVVVDGELNPARDGVLGAVSTGAAHVNRGPVALAGIPRRLTPRECERLMGWPDDWTLVPGANGKPLRDGPRYKIIGNGVATPVAHWIALRISMAMWVRP